MQYAAWAGRPPTVRHWYTSSIRTWISAKSNLYVHTSKYIQKSNSIESVNFSKFSVCICLTFANQILLTPSLYHIFDPFVINKFHLWKSKYSLMKIKKFYLWKSKISWTKWKILSVKIIKFIEKNQKFHWQKSKISFVEIEKFIDENQKFHL